MNEMNYDDFKSHVIELWSSGEFSSQKKLAEHIEETCGIMNYANFESMRRAINLIIRKSQSDEEIISENVKLAKQKQKFADLNRVERKAFREYARVENAVSEYANEINKQLKVLGNNLKVSLKRISRKDGWIGIMQFTDLHGNEMIDLPHNQYNFSVLAQRMKKYVNECLDYFEFIGVEKVLIAFTGDLLNSDRRLDELLNQATNRSKATVIMAHIITQAVVEVSQYYPVEILSVLGNESRVNKEMTFSNEAFSDNYDFTIMAMVREIIIASGIPDINFLSIDQVEMIVSFDEQSWLFAHDVSKFTDNQGKTQQAIGRHALSGNKVDFVIGGHIHALRATDISCRSGSMSGSNSYNENALNLHGHASGVCYAVRGKERKINYIDLQYTDKKHCYLHEEKMEAYNIKSDGKNKPQTTIFSVTI